MPVTICTKSFGPRPETQSVPLTVLLSFPRKRESRIVIEGFPVLFIASGCNGFRTVGNASTARVTHASGFPLARE